MVAPEEVALEVELGLAADMATSQEVQHLAAEHVAVGTVAAEGDSRSLPHMPQGHTQAAAEGAAVAVAVAAVVFVQAAFALLRVAIRVAARAF